MSRNGSGTYTLPAGNPVVTGTTISSTWANNTLADIQNALTGSIASDGQTTITGPLKGTNGTVSFAGVGQTRIPVGTTAQRAATPLDGMIRYNTDIQQYEGYKNGAWSIFGNGAGGTLFSDTVTATQGQTVINTPTGFVQGGDNLSVYVNGSRQIYNVNYTETSSTQITFTNGLNVGDLVNYTIGASTSLSVNASSVLYNEGSTSAVDQNVEQKLQETVSVKDFGAVGDGVTDDTTAIQNAITNTSTETIIYFPVGTYLVTSTLEMPLKVSGNFTIDGDVIWSFKKEILQEGQITVTGDITLDSVWESKFMHLECAGDLTIQSSNVTWGTFWNDFGTIRTGGTLIIDVDQGQSVNQNNFNTCKCTGGLHIKGVATTGIREAHNNIFTSIDTTGANLTATDGTTGVHILNDSDENQCNNILNWYAEISGSRLVYGNWNVLGSNIDSISNPYMINRSNSSLFSGLGGRNGSYLAIASQNICASGDWSKLTGTGIPLDLSTGTASTVVALTDTPSGSTVGYKQVGGGTFRSHRIKYPLTTSNKVVATAFVYQEGTPSTVTEVYSNGVLQGAGVSSLTPLGGNWYLLRIASPSKVIDTAGGFTTGDIYIYTTTSTALTAADFRTLTNFYVTTETTAALPSANFNQTLGYSTAIPTAGIWKVGDICWNTAPASGSPAGWVCTVAGAPGTWKAMANLA